MNKTKSIVSVLLVFALLFPAFSGISAADATERYTVTLLKAGKVIVGDATGNVNEDKPLKREELVAMLLQLSAPKLDGTFKLPSTPSFKDVPKTHWAYEIVEKGKYYGLTSGIGNGNFGIGQYVTYQQALTFVTKMVGLDLPWATILTEAPQYGFSSVEPANGGKFLRGHMFDLTLRALVHYDYSDDGGYLWGEHIMANMSEKQREDMDYFNVGEPYIADARYLKTAWGNSAHASKTQLENRFDASQVQWTPAKLSDLKGMVFNLELKDQEYGNVPWTVSYDEEYDMVSGEFHGSGYGGYMSFNDVSVYSNSTLQFNGQLVKTFLLTGYNNFEGGTEPYRLIVQMNDKGFVRGWLDTYSMTKDLDKIFTE